MEPEQPQNPNQRPAAALETSADLEALTRLVRLLARQAASEHMSDAASSVKGAVTTPAPAAASNAPASSDREPREQER